MPPFGDIGESSMPMMPFLMCGKAIDESTIRIESLATFWKAGWNTWMIRWCWW